MAYLTCGDPSYHEWTVQNQLFVTTMLIYSVCVWAVLHVWLGHGYQEGDQWYGLQVVRQVPRNISSIWLIFIRRGQVAYILLWNWHYNTWRVKIWMVKFGKLLCSWSLVSPNYHGTKVSLHAYSITLKKSSCVHSYLQSSWQSI